MSELAESKDYIERKRRENRKLLDAAELVVFALSIPDKAKLLCLYFLRTCDWLTLTRGEGRAALALMLNCSEDQVSRYTRPLNEAGIIRITAFRLQYGGQLALVAAQKTSQNLAENTVQITTCGPQSAIMDVVTNAARTSWVLAYVSRVIRRFVFKEDSPLQQPRLGG